MADIRISALPQAGGQRQPVLDRAVAQRHDYGFQADSGDAELGGLVRGLSALNPELQVATDMAIQEGAREARRAGIAEANRVDMSNIAAEELAGRPLPSSVPPAFDTAYREGLKSVLGDRSGAELKAEMLREYNEKKDTEGFSFGGFLSGFRSRAMAGFNDPLMVAKVGQHINSMEVSLRDNFERERLQKQAEAVDTAYAQVVQDKLDPTKGPEELFITYHNELLPEARRIGKSAKDAARVMFERINQMSDQLGGAPQLYDLFEFKDKDGLSMAARNPEMARMVAAARDKAEATLDRNMIAANEKNVFQSLVGLDNLRKTNPAAITPELVKGMIGKHNVFPTAEAAMSYYRQAQAGLSKDNGVSELQAAHDGRVAGSLPPDAQKDLMEAHFGPAVTAMFQAAVSTDPEASAKVPAMAEDIVRRLTWHGYTEPMPQLQRYVERLGSQLPSKEGPDGAFKAAAVLYKAMAAHPLVRSKYFKDDTAELLEAYTAATDMGGDPKAAYASAYEAITPAAKSAAAAMAKDPEFIKKMKDSVDAAIGSSWWPQMLGGKGRPTNADGVEMDARIAAGAYKRSHPSATVEDLSAYAKRYVETNYIHDETTKTLVKVPPVAATPAAQEAITAYSKALTEQFRLETGLPGDWKVHYRPEGPDGTMSVSLANSTGGSYLVGRQTIQQIVAAHHYETHIDHNQPADGSPSEAMRLAEVKRQLREAKVDPAYMQANRKLIDKARALKLLPQADIKAIDQLSLDATLKNLKELPSMSFGKADQSAIASAPKGRGKVDPKLTAQVAQRFALAPPGQLGSATQQLAASLITMGEAVVLQAYPDPAKDAGMNIGAGYNLKANAARAREDLKRSGVPESRIEDVINGRAQLTTDQVMRLTQIAIPRYEELARKEANKTAPGLWDRMTTQQRAVMVDVAYQVGSTEQFRKAWQALAAGDQATFEREAQTTYVNQDGVRVADKRRNSLRAAMLQGLPHWDATVSRYGSLPGSQVDVAALNSK